MKRKRTHSKLARPFKILRLALYLILTLILVVALDQAPSYQASEISNGALRGIWITNRGTSFLYQTTRLDEALHQLATLKFNTVYPAVWNRGYTLYPSSVADKQTGSSYDPTLALPLQNILSSLVKQAHRQGLSVIPWFEYGLMVPVTSSLVQKHPDWVTQNLQGEKILKPHSQNSLASRLPTPLRNLAYELTGANLVWLNPFHPEVQQFFTDLILEVVSQYDIDGIQLDDHFGLPTALGYDPYTIELYQQEHWGNNPPQEPYNSQWLNWRAQKFTQFLEKISTAVKQAKPDCTISISPNPAPFALREYLQDWVGWARKGLIDQVVVQIYRDNPQSLETELAQGSLRTAQNFVPVSIGLYTGSLMSPKPIEDIAQQVKTVQEWDYNGVSLFSWETTLGMFKQDSEEAVEKVLQDLFD